MDNLAQVTLANLQKGQVLEDLSREIRRTLGRLEECRGGKAEIHLKLVITANDDEAQEVKVKGIVVPAKLPAKDHGENIFYVTEDKGLSRSNPAQPELNFEAKNGTMN